jgi:AcrR family transcriptional regulator
MLRAMVARARSNAAKKSPAPPGLTRDRVCRAALELVDEEGLEALSMRRLGARLGVEAMSLYRHVRDKADVLDALHAAVLEEAPLGDIDPSDWRGILYAIAAGLRATLLRHPNVIPLLATRPPTERAPDARVRWTWAALERAGFAAEDARRALIVVGIFTLGHVLGEAHGEPAPHLGMPGRPGVIEFEFGLGALLDGIGVRCLGGKRVKVRRAGAVSARRGSR